MLLFFPKSVPVLIKSFIWTSARDFGQYRTADTLVNVYVDLLVFTRIAGTS